MNCTISDQFIDILWSISNLDLPANVMEQAELCILDYKGCAFAGAKILRQKESNFIAKVEKQGGNVSVIGFDNKTTLHNAAFLQGMSAHITELDDGHRMGMIHLGASILSALLPVAELEKIPEKDVLLGTVVGYEAAVRMAIAMQPSHKIRGFHTSGTCGTVGAAMAIASAMHFSREQMKTTLSASCASASGLLEMQEDGSELKPYNLAHAASAGITAAYCGMASFEGPNDPLCGKRGMISIMSDKPNLNILIEKNDYFEIERIYRKPYAACRHCHPAIEAVLKIKHDFGLKYSEIDYIHVETYKMAVIGHDHKIIQGISSAKLSLPYCVALAFIKDSVGISEFSEKNLSDNNIISLMKKTSVVINEELTSLSPQKRAAIVKVTTIDGKVFSCKIDYPKGEPENPMLRCDVEAKFKELINF